MTFDELRLQQLLGPFNRPQGITSLNPLAFRFQQESYLPNPSGTSDQGYAIGPYGTSNTGYSIGPFATPDDMLSTGLYATPDDMVGTTAPGTADDMISTGFYATPDMNFPFAPANRLAGLNLNKFEGVASLGRNDEDVEQVDLLPGQTKSIRQRIKELGSAGLAGIFAKVNPALSFISKGLKGIASLNNRLQQSEFGRSKTLKEFLDKRRERKAAEQRAADKARLDAIRAIRSGDGGGGRSFDTSAADKAGTSLGSGQFSPSSSRGRSGY